MHASYLLLFVKHKTTQKRHALLDAEVLEHILEDHLCQQELVTCANLAGHTALQLHHVRRCRELKSRLDASHVSARKRGHAFDLLSQNALSASEFL